MSTQRVPRVPSTSSPYARTHGRTTPSRVPCDPDPTPRGTLSALDALTGHRIPGGCDDCDAYQTVARQPNEAWGGVYVLTVHHDDGCPFLTGVTR